MLIDSLITRPAITVKLDDRLGYVNDLFVNHSFHHLLVIGDDGKLVGVLSDRDLLKALSPRLGTAAENTKDLATLNKRVHQIATRKPFHLKEHSSLADVVKIFYENKISCIPIVDNDRRPVGVISWRDIVKYLYKKIEVKAAKNNQ